MRRQPYKLTGTLLCRLAKPERHSVALTDGSFMKPPNVLNARRWIKQLIDRSSPTLATATCFATTERLLWSRVPRAQVAGAGHCRQTPSPVSNLVETLMSECCCHTVMHIHNCCYIAMQRHCQRLCLQSALGGGAASTSSQACRCASYRPTSRSHQQSSRVEQHWQYSGLTLCA